MIIILKKIAIFARQFFCINAFNKIVLTLCGKILYKMDYFNANQRKNSILGS
jgi:hypothetical protein